MTEIKQQNLEIITQYALDLQGHSFQSVVLKEIVGLSEAGRTKFKYFKSEFPVTCHNRNTHIDFILEWGSIFLIGECKRKYNFKNWCFFQMPYSSSSTDEKLIDVYSEKRGYDAHNKQSITRNLSSFTINNAALPVNENCEVYTTGLAIESIEILIKHKNTKLSLDGSGVIEKTSLTNLKKDDHKAMFDDSIYQATNQVLLSSGGFVNELIQRPQHPSNFTGEINYYFVPAIFTNANLFVSDVELANSSLETGNLTENLELKPVDYVWFSYNRSEELQPEFNKIENRDFKHFNVVDRIGYNSSEQRHNRSILFINSNALEKALSLPFGKMLNLIM